MMQRRGSPCSGEALRRLARAATLLGTVACTSPATVPAAPGAPPGAAATAAAPSAVATPLIAPPIKMRLPYTAVSVAHAPLWVAKESGSFQQEGVDAELEYIATSTTVTQSMLSGEIGLANSGLEALVAANLAGADLVGLAVGTDRFLFRLYGRPEVRRFADLRGQRVAVTRLGTSTDTVARLLLQRDGLDPASDVTVVQVGGVPEIFAALQSGAADAGVLSPPTTSKADAAGFQVLADTTELDIPFHQAVLTSTRRYVADQAETLRRVLRGYLRGIARYKQDREYAKQVIAQYTRDEASSLDQSWALEDRVLSRVPYPRVEAVQLALDQAAARQPEARALRPEEFFDDRPLREIEKGGFVAGLYR
jgi:NitT/TauT family transport system substrate-binding protein